MPIHTDVALLTESRYLTPKPDDPYTCQIHLEESLLGEALRACGLSTLRVDWADPRFDWSQVSCALFRSTWDYFYKIDRFRSWLSLVRSQTLLLNPLPLIHWNIDKHYLKDLEARGVPIVPTHFLETQDRSTLPDILSSLGWQDAVLKPAVSGSARNTFRLQRYATDLLPLEACLEHETMMLQPFQHTILEQGERSLIVVDGQVCHAVRKIPRPGDFRVQDDHGGKVLPHLPDEDDTAFALSVVHACPSPPLYARVDFVVTAEGQRLLMELELVEPELFFRFNPATALRLAQGVKRLLSRSIDQQSPNQPRKGRHR